MLTNGPYKIVILREMRLTAAKPVSGNSPLIIYGGIF